MADEQVALKTAYTAKEVAEIVTQLGDSDLESIDHIDKNKRDDDLVHGGDILALMSQVRLDPDKSRIDIISAGNVWYCVQ